MISMLTLGTMQFQGKMQTSLSNGEIYIGKGGEGEIWEVDRSSI